MTKHSSSRMPAWMKRDLSRSSPRHEKFEYRGFFVAQDTHRRTTIRHVINRARRGVGLFEGRGAKDAAIRWIDSLYGEGRAEVMLWRKPDGWRYEDEPHPLPVEEGNARLVAHYRRWANDLTQPRSHRKIYAARIAEYERTGGRLVPKD